MDNMQGNLSLLSFMWSLVKQLPPLILMALGIVLGITFCWMLAQVSFWYFAGLVCAGIVLVFVIAVCKAAQ